MIEKSRVPRILPLELGYLQPYHESDCHGLQYVTRIHEGCQEPISCYCLELCEFQTPSGCTKKRERRLVIVRHLLQSEKYNLNGVLVALEV